jgi:hypothetical protein
MSVFNFSKFTNKCMDKELHVRDQVKTLACVAVTSLIRHGGAISTLSGKTIYSGIKRSFRARIIGTSTFVAIAYPT